MHKITVIIKPDGTTDIDFSGFVGKTCLDEGAKLTALLQTYGIELAQTSFIPKPELAQLLAQEEQQQKLTQEGA